jgi:hypothetical protein
MTTNRPIVKDVEEFITYFLFWISMKKPNIDVEGAGIAQSVQRLATDWRAEELQFGSR